MNIREIDAGGLFQSLAAAQKAANNDGRGRLVKLSDYVKKEGDKK